jgi:hypothetical protein
MRKLHDSSYRNSLRSRLQALRPDAQRKFGKMTADQMLWHVASGMELAMGRMTAAPSKPPVSLPKPLLRFAVIKLPWPKNFPTVPVLLARGTYDFETERQRCLKLMDEMAARDVNGPWPVHPTLGEMSGLQYSLLHGKHVDHHLKQFGA